MIGEILAKQRFFLENHRDFCTLYWISSFPFRTFKESSRNVQKMASFGFVLKPPQLSLFTSVLILYFQFDI
jgi:hypothetical protein